MLRNVIILCIVSFFLGCGMKRPADKIFYNGKVYTVNKGFSIVEAFAVRNGKIIDIGSNKDILDLFEAKEKVDLKGKPVYPGFIDAHCHFYGYATDKLKCDLYGTTSFEDVVERVKSYSTTNKFQWLLGRGWDQNNWATKEFPSKAILDSLFPAQPVFLMRIDGHAALCNSAALSLAGVNSSTKVTGGEVVLVNGQLTGMLVDNAVDLVKKKIPPFTDVMITDALLKAEKECFSLGLTTVDDAGLGKDSIAYFLHLQNENKLKIRIYAMLSDDPATLNYFFKEGPFKTDRLNIRAIKTYVDGALGSRGALLKEPYSDQPGHYGYLLKSNAALQKLADDAIESGFQLCSHAIGDSAVKTVLDLYANHLNGENNRRWRIEHCQIVSPKDLHLFGDNAIIPSVQPTHATSDMYWAGNRIGNRLPTAYAYRDLKDQAGGIIAFGTDFPVEQINPLYTFYAAITRKNLDGNPESGFQSENKIKKKDALRAMTIWAAYANFEDDEKGSIEEDKFADFVILNDDIMTIDEEEIPNVKVIATYVNGEKTF